MMCRAEEHCVKESSADQAVTSWFLFCRTLMCLEYCFRFITILPTHFSQISDCIVLLFEQQKNTMRLQFNDERIVTLCEKKLSMSLPIYFTISEHTLF